MKILFVCSGNTCRSPMAEGYLNSLKIEGLEASSAGLNAALGDRVSENSVAVMQDIGIDISNHNPKPITRHMIENADKIICMTPTHKALLKLSGINADISVLGTGIMDPFGSDEDIYALCRNEIIREIDKLISGVVIRELKPSDITEIANIEKECFSSPWSEKAITDAVDNGTVFLVAEAAFKVVGYVSFNYVLDEGYINNIAVKGQARNKGVAKKLLTALSNKATDLKLSFISLEVRKSNTAAISLYNKCGYKDMGVRKDFYAHPKEDAIIMTKEGLV